MEMLKQKLTSRKFWAALLAAVFSIAVSVFGDTLDAEMVGVLKTGIYGLIAYIFGEGAVDVARIITQKKEEETDKDTETANEDILDGWSEK